MVCFLPEDLGVFRRNAKPLVAEFLNEGLIDLCFESVTFLHGTHASLVGLTLKLTGGDGTQWNPRPVQRLVSGSRYSFLIFIS